MSVSACIVFVAFLAVDEAFFRFFENALQRFSKKMLK